MKRGLGGKLFLGIFLFVFLSSGVFADIVYGNCEVVNANECLSGNNDTIVLRLSDLTNAHVQLPSVGTYPYVLCCDVGTGSTTCSGNNEVIGLSATTNAHAESPDRSAYSISACYSDLVCEKITSATCPTTRPKGVLSLSAETNAHVGTFNVYPTKICCGGPSITASSCTFKTATWSVANAIRGQGIRLVVTGSGSECNGRSITFNVREDDVGSTQPVTTNPVNVAFNGATATGMWFAEWQDDGIGDPEYIFEVSMDRNSRISKVSSNKLSVTRSEDFCESNAIASCEDYVDQLECESDASLCSVAGASSLPEINCDADSTVCSCIWNDQTSSCRFGWGEISPGACGNGYTLCHKEGADYCYPGNVCPSGNEPISDGDGVCESGEGCLSADCDNGDQGSCVSGATCLNDMCFSSTLPIVNPTCEYGYTLCHKPGSSRNYCYPGSTCMSGENPISNNNGTCESQEGCSSTDCKDGELDTCTPGLYCLSDECSTVENPIILQLLGNCQIQQTIEKGCEEEPVGYKIITWTGNWTGDSTGTSYQRCIAGGRTTIPCAAQVQLPFFDYFELVATLVVLAIIYLALLYKKKHHHKKKK
ncbi:MAG: hypothetical protein WC511_05055 [Candidatus Pacearchaeota archaeon]